MNALLTRGAVSLCLMFVLGAVLVSCARQDTEDLILADALTLHSVEDEVFELINDHRSSIGLAALTNINIAYPKAAEHTEYMIVNGEVSHDNFYEREAYLVSEAGANSVAENVAFAYSTAQGVVNAWLNSSSHKAIIEGDYTHGSICVKRDSNGDSFYTHLFIKK